jgi:hypothetical protein
MKSLMRRARKDPEMLWTTFQCWYRPMRRNEMPCWIIERIDGDEFHVHLWDYATGAIEDSIRKFCAQKKLDFSAEIVKDPLPERHLCISKNGQPLLRMHNTSCSTNADPFICVHLRQDDKAIKTLLVLFEISFYPESLTFYQKLYRQSHPGLEELRYHRWHIGGPGTGPAAPSPRST